MKKILPGLFFIFNSQLRWGFHLLILVCSAQFSFAQNPLVKQWDYRFGGIDDEMLFSLGQTFDSGYILGGLSYSSVSGDKTQPSWGISDYWIVKTNSLGSYQWDKRFGGNDNDVLFSLHQTTDRGYILGGYSLSGNSGDKSQSSRGLEDYWVVKTDSLGIKQWDKRFGGTLNDYLYEVQQTRDHGYILGGFSLSDSSGDKTQNNWPHNWGASYHDYWIVKIDSLGNKEWDKRYGGSGDDYFSSVQQTTDGGYILGGFAGSGVSGDKTQDSWGDWDYWIIRIDSVGAILWDKDFGAIGQEVLHSLQQTSDGGFILGGYSYSGINGDKSQDTWGGLDYWIVKIDSLGTKQWDKDFGGTSDDWLYSVQQTSDGGYLLAGNSISPVSGDKTEANFTYYGQGQVWIIKTDSFGNKEWDKTIFNTGNGEMGPAIQVNDGCYVSATFTWADTGGYKTQPAWGENDYWIIKFCDTTLMSSAAFNVDDKTVCEKFCANFLDQSINYPASWQWQFPGGDPSSSTLQNPNNICYNLLGTYDVTLITTNANGNDTLTLHNYITVNPTPPIPTITHAGDILTSSTESSYQWQFNAIDIPGATNQSYIALQSGLYTVVVGDSNSCKNSFTTYMVISGINDAMSDGNISIIPNPSNGNFTIEFTGLTAGSDLTGDVSIEVVNTVGQIIFSSIASQSIRTSSFKKRIDLGSVAAGVYIIEIKTKDVLLRKKMVIEE